jgi:hypothetical protein
VDTFTDTGTTLNGERGACLSLHHEHGKQDEDENEDHKDQKGHGIIRPD